MKFKSLVICCIIFVLLYSCVIFSVYKYRNDANPIYLGQITEVEVHRGTNGG